METSKTENKAMTGAGLAPSRSRRVHTNVPKTGRSRPTTFLVTKAFCGIKAGTELVRDANSSHVKYMIEKGYIKAK